jgi:hypothetical protein
LAKIGRFANIKSGCRSVFFFTRLGQGCLRFGGNRLFRQRGFLRILKTHRTLEPEAFTDKVAQQVCAFSSSKTTGVGAAQTDTTGPSREAFRLPLQAQ